MPHAVTIHRPAGPVRASIALPRSKSVSNRALIMASLLGDLGLVSHLSDGDDTRMSRVTGTVIDRRIRRKVGGRFE